MKVVSVVGARPQFIKAAMVSRVLREKHTEVLVHTGQHYDGNMSAVFFDELGIPEPDVNLGIGSGRHGAQTGAMLTGIESVLLEGQPDWVLVYGDTNSTLAGALAAAKLHIPVAHVEAGLRSFNRAMPEEINRVIADHLSDLLLCPSQTAVDNLATEGITRGVHLVGDVMADALAFAVERAQNHSDVLERMGLSEGSYLLATVHRAENTNDATRLRSILTAFDALNEPVIFPVHPRTRKAINALGHSLAPHVQLIEPVGYLDMVMLEKSARMILTDSGGIQKEAYWLGVPCVTLRDETEWIETVEAGWNVLVGADTEAILQAVHSSPPAAHPALYGDGRTAGRIVEALLEGPEGEGITRCDSESETAAGQTIPVPSKKKSSFAADVLKLTSGATIAQALGILLSPVFSRLFSPEAFGTAAVFISITTVIGVVVCLRYELAIMLPEKDEDAANLLVGSLLFVGIFTVLTTLGVVFLREPVCRWLKAPELEPFLWMVPISVFLSGAALALRYWNTRLKRFGLLSGLRVAASASANSVKLGTGLLGYVGAGSMIASSMLSQIVSAVGMGWQSLRKCDLRLWSSVSSYSIRQVLVRYKDFPRYAALSGLLNSFSWQLPNFLLSAFFSATVVGYYSVSLRVFNIPLSLIGGAIGQVFLQRAAEAKVTGNLPLIVENAFRTLFMLGLFPAVLLTMTGKSLFTFVFGEPWAEAGVYVQMLGFWLIFRFVSSPLSTLFSVLEKQRAGLALNSTVFLTRLISLAVGGMLGSARLAILLFALSGAAVYGGLALWITRLAGVPWSHVKSIVLTGLKPGFLIALPLFIAMLLQVGDLMQVVLSGVLLLFYYFWIVQNDKAFRGLFFRLKNRLRLGNG